jgi:hypothetical protein
VIGGRSLCQKYKATKVEKTGGALVARQSQVLFTISGFHGWKSWKSCIQIHEIMKSEILNWWKVL